MNFSKKLEFLSLVPSKLFQFSLSSTSKFTAVVNYSCKKFCNNLTWVQREAATTLMFKILLQISGVSTRGQGYKTFFVRSLRFFVLVGLG